MQISLPENVLLKCSACDKSFVVRRDDLDGLSELACPFCRHSFNLYEGLSGQTRRAIYGSVRAFIEARVWEQQQLDDEAYFEDAPNLS